MTVAPGNPARGLPRVQAVYLHFDRDTSLTAVLDGTALTTLRTPAVSIAAVRHLPDRPPGSSPPVPGPRPPATWSHWLRSDRWPASSTWCAISGVPIDALLLPLGSTEADGIGSR